MVKRFDVVMMRRDGLEMPCVVVSPDELNEVLPYVLIAPITVFERAYPTRLAVGLRGKKGQIALDMIYTLFKDDIVRKIGCLPEALHEEVVGILGKMFCA